MSKQSLRIENWELRNVPLCRAVEPETCLREAMSQFSILNFQFSIPLLP